MGQTISFAADIRPLFTRLDIDHMAWFCDLSNYDDVKANAQDILGRLQGSGGSVMPPAPADGGDGPWSADKITLFESWINAGYPP